MSREKYKIRFKRVYDELSAADGACFLVDRMWPRGVRKTALSSVTWLRDVAPSAPLRKWFSHDPAKWPDFQTRYRSELLMNSTACDPLLEAMQKRNITLLFAAKDAEMNNAVVLRKFLEEKLR